MTKQTLVSRYPGSRIEGYRNSRPRVIKLIAVGPEAERLVAGLIDPDRDNVLMSGRIAPHDTPRWTCPWTGSGPMP